MPAACEQLHSGRRALDGDCMEELSSAGRFLAAFSKLRARVNDNPRNIAWMAARSEEVLLLDVIGTCVAWDTLCRELAESPTKSFERSPPMLRAAYEEFRAKWLEPVERAFEKLNPEFFAARSDVQQFLIWNASGDEGTPTHPVFDVVVEDHANLVENALATAADVGDVWEDQVGDDLKKGQQAWQHFCSVTGFDLRQASQRWRAVEPVFVPAHVSNAYGASDPKSLSRLLDEAVRAYVFGAPAASIAMCRSLMEEVLRHHYRFDGPDMEKVIAAAEARPHFAWIRGLKLQAHRKVANAVLHEGKSVEEAAVAEFLSVVKALIERAPAQGTR